MMRWVIHSETTFEADHALTAFRGEAEESHRHTWKVAITVGVAELSSEGYALDFNAVHAILRAAASDLDGSDLNDHIEIGTPSPTAERVAEVMSARLAPRLDEIGGALLKVSVWEGAGNRVDLNL